MKAYSSRELIEIITADGWYLVHTVGDHHQFKHPTKKGKVTITHPQKEHSNQNGEKYISASGA